MGTYVLNINFASMLIKYSDNLFMQVGGVIYHNRNRLIAFVIISAMAVVQYEVSMYYGWWIFEMPVIPVSILGGALAIFLAFRNNHAYDRWWEARKIWGGIVNTSRTFGMMLLSFASTHFSKGRISEEQVKSWQKDMIYRHLAWINALVLHLRKQRECDKFSQYLDQQELERLISTTNRPAQLINTQGQRLKDGFEQGIIEDFRHMELANLLKELYSLQGQSERIKNTVFPYYYNYFTRVFLWLFIIAFPFLLVTEADWWITILMSVSVSFVFSILEKAGTITEDPFEGRASDTPLSSIARNIEIDLLEMLGEDEIPDPISSKIGRFEVEYLE